MNKELTHHQPLLSPLYNICPGQGTQSLTTNKDNNKIDLKFIFTGNLLMKDFHLKLGSHLQERYMYSVDCNIVNIFNPFAYRWKVCNKIISQQFKFTISSPYWRWHVRFPGWRTSINIPENSHQNSFILLLTTHLCYSYTQDKCLTLQYDYKLTLLSTVKINLTVNYFFKLFKKFRGNYGMALVACKNSHLSLPLGMSQSGPDVPLERWLFCRLGPLQCFTF